MSNILLKTFVKNYDDIHNQSVRTGYGMLASVVGILCNVLLFITKLSIGFFLNSISVMADSINNLSDAASSIISFVGVKMAERPADKEHPFGHGRLEYIAALIVSFVVLLVGFNLLKDSVLKIMNPTDVVFQWWLVGILLITVGVKVWLSLFNRKLGNRIQSKILLATAADSRNDVLVTSATIISLIVGHFMGVNIDGYMGVLVSLLVLFAGYQIAKDTLLPLLGEAVEKDMYIKISRLVEEKPLILGSHDLVAHNYGPSKIMATIHVEVSSDSTLEEVHEVIDQIEKEVEKEMGIHMVIHVDPVQIHDKKTEQLKQKILKLIHDMEKEASIHDFRTIPCKEEVRIVFELVVPYSYDESKKKEFQETLSKKIEELSAIETESKVYRSEILVENSFISE